MDSNHLSGGRFKIIKDKNNLTIVLKKYNIITAFMQKIIQDLT